MINNTKSGINIPHKYHQIESEIELYVTELDDAEELFSIIDNNRKYLRKWLPWLDEVKSVEDEKSFILHSHERLLRGRGIITKCCKKLISHCFNDLGLNSFILEVAKENTLSRAVAERIGMRLEGIKKDREWLYDHFVDGAHYSITKNEWKTIDS